MGALVNELPVYDCGLLQMTINMAMLPSAQSYVTASGQYLESQMQVVSFLVTK